MQSSFTRNKVIEFTQLMPLGSIWQKLLKNKRYECTGSIFEGVLLVDKLGLPHMTVDRLRRKLKMKKIGHAGTLDPLATWFDDYVNW